MAKPSAVDPVKFFVAILWRDSAAIERALVRLAQALGAIDHAGQDHPFDSTDYYRDEMGSDLARRLVAFAPLHPPERLRTAKLDCNRIEETLALDGRRTVNLDVGYLDHHKVVLGSVKGAGQKIHLGDGVFADLVARFRAGKYQPFDWTFLDFRDGRYDAELSTMREEYLCQLRDQHTNKARPSSFGGR